MKHSSPKIQETSDGSHTLHSSIFEATYHSSHGAIQEAQVVFLDAALNYQLAKGNQDIHILEIGFGSGLNALMTFKETAQHPNSIYYEGWEAYPIGIELASQMNYPQVLDLSEEEQASFLQMHHSVNQITVLRTNPSFKFQLKKDYFEAIEAENEFDIIYHDAFAPSVQAELWETTFLQKLYRALKTGGVLTTYCAQGAFKRALKACGFKVEALPGPKGKREMTRAHKID